MLKCLKPKEKSWMIKNNIQSYTKRWDRTDFTTLTIPSETETRTSLTFTGGKKEDSWDTTRFKSTQTCEIGRLLWIDSIYLLCWKFLTFTLMVFKERRHF